MVLLSTGQRRAITMIVTAEAGGIAMSRLLKTAYSCPHCGLVVGRSCESKEARKVALGTHIESCDTEVRWKFACSYSSYYGQWRKSETFVECLDEARAEVITLALGDASRILQLGTPDAAMELRRQIGEGTKDFDRRQAAIALLDRADVQTAGKTSDSVTRWLEALREDDTGGEMADGSPEGHDVSDGKAHSEFEATGEDT